MEQWGVSITRAGATSVGNKPLRPRLATAKATNRTLPLGGKGDGQTQRGLAEGPTRHAGGGTHKHRRLC